ncbi:hypothetical protein GUITHDRAFT_115224 [Guillardia theta CCMP2712]|uniref:Uncharacterized protein n=1 Tax=Guillardia theta (strain CCMP2712) TaxID=905079 RepID=L1IQW5_GUITC|nr:hypothetical protein GUITHDRAFT_115224 [Guillardia theta CCMP2712]EKX38676.1 hypothetical protein GUITHDRAFT_115224 [Guillardia theta CCMP2712]|eukprot:XP_005825656.1 hypothetical protein GUITHDRAFT_115224 [Guillardia theta CCMP2712]
MRICYCTTWFQEDMANRRLVASLSMGSRGGRNYDKTDKVNKVKELTVYSWTLEESEDVSSGRLANDDEAGANLVESKYQMAGGSCRYMFDFTTSEVVKGLSVAIGSVQDYDAILNFEVAG